MSDQQYNTQTSFIIIETEKILTPERLQQANFWYFYWENDWNN